MPTNQENNSTFSKQDLETILHAPEARALLTIMQKDGGQSVSAASKAVKKGNLAQAVAILKPMLENAGSEQLLRSLNQKLERSQQ